MVNREGLLGGVFDGGLFDGALGAVGIDGKRLGGVRDGGILALALGAPLNEGTRLGIKIGVLLGGAWLDLLGFFAFFIAALFGALGSPLISLIFSTPITLLTFLGVLNNFLGVIPLPALTPKLGNSLSTLCRAWRSAFLARACCLGLRLLLPCSIKSLVPPLTSTKAFFIFSGLVSVVRMKRLVCCLAICSDSRTNFILSLLVTGLSLRKNCLSFSESLTSKLSPAFLAALLVGPACAAGTLISISAVVIPAAWRTPRLATPPLITASLLCSMPIAFLTFLGVRVRGSVSLIGGGGTSLSFLNVSSNCPPVLNCASSALVIFPVRASFCRLSSLWIRPLGLTMRAWRSMAGDTLDSIIAPVRNAGVLRRLAPISWRGFSAVAILMVSAAPMLPVAKAPVPFLTNCPFLLPRN